MAKNSLNDGIGDSLAILSKMNHTDDEGQTKLEKKGNDNATIKVTREVMASNGCRVTLNFSNQSKPDLRLWIANLLIEGFMEARRKEFEETCTVSVPSIDQTAS